MDISMHFFISIRIYDMAKAVPRTGFHRNVHIGAHKVIIFTDSVSYTHKI